MDAGHEKHPDEVQGDRGPDRHRADTHPEGAEAPGMQEDERHDPDPVDPVRLRAHLFGPSGAIIRVDPLADGGQGAMQGGGG